MKKGRLFLHSRKISLFRAGWIRKFLTNLLNCDNFYMFFKDKRKKGDVMKKLLSLLLSFIIITMFIGCVRKGTVTDIAKIKQADRAIKLIRNALEEYYIDHKSYPEDGANLKEILASYMGKTKTAKGLYISNWDKNILPAFSEGPFYSTIDPKSTYFVKAKATDINKTPISVRPTIIRKQKEEKKKKNK